MKDIIKMATDDPRNVMLYAEYKNLEDEWPKRIRKLDKPFDEMEHIQFLNKSGASSRKLLRHV